MQKENNKDIGLHPEAVFVKKKVTASEWNNYYSQVGSYCYLGRADRGVWIGFMVANKVPIDCEKLNPAEVLQMKEYYQQINNPFFGRYEKQYPTNN